jgi:type IV secretory pathway TrbF-like protein
MTNSLNPAALPTLEQATAKHFEYYGSTLTTNTALKIALLGALSAVAVLSFNNYRVSKAMAHIRPVVVRIDAVGRAEAVNTSTDNGKPQAKEVKYFLRQFVIHHFGRNRATVAANYVESIYFLESNAANAINEADRKTMWLPKFITSNEDNVDVEVSNVVIEELEAEPYRARVDFTKVFTTVQGSESKREHWAAEIQFRINPEVSNDLVPHNPLGFAITFFRADQAFQ